MYLESKVKHTFRWYYVNSQVVIVDYDLPDCKHDFDWQTVNSDLITTINYNQNINKISLSC